MASGGELDQKMKEMFQYFNTENPGGSAAEKKVCKSSTVGKIMKATFGNDTASKVDASIFSKYCDKKTKKITDDDFVDKLLPELAKMQLVDKKKATSKTPLDDPSVTEQLQEVKTKLAKKFDDTKAGEKKTKDADVVNRLTDAKGYTGSHKERFDAEGKGKGKDGRVEQKDTSGYVGAYKNAGTFGQKK